MDIYVPKYLPIIHAPTPRGKLCKPASGQQQRTSYTTCRTGDGKREPTTPELPPPSRLYIYTGSCTRYSTIATPLMEIKPVEFSFRLFNTSCATNFPFSCSQNNGLTTPCNHFRHFQKYSTNNAHRRKNVCRLSTNGNYNGLVFHDW